MESMIFIVLFLGSTSGVCSHSQWTATHSSQKVSVNATAIPFTSAHLFPFHHNNYKSTSANQNTLLNGSTTLPFPESSHKRLNFHPDLHQPQSVTEKNQSVFEALDRQSRNAIPKSSYLLPQDRPSASYPGQSGGYYPGIGSAGGYGGYGGMGGYSNGSTNGFSGGFGNDNAPDNPGFGGNYGPTPVTSQSYNPTLNRPFSFNYQSDNGLSIDIKGFSPSDMEQVTLTTPDGTRVSAKWVADLHSFRLEVFF